MWRRRALTETAVGELLCAHQWSGGLRSAVCDFKAGALQDTKALDSRQSSTLHIHRIIPQRRDARAAAVDTRGCSAVTDTVFTRGCVAPRVTQRALTLMPRFRTLSAVRTTCSLAIRFGFRFRSAIRNGTSEPLLLFIFSGVTHL